MAQIGTLGCIVASLPARAAPEVSLPASEQRIRRLEAEVSIFLNKLEGLVESLGEVGAAERLAAKRAEFSAPVRRQAIERSGGFCEAVGGVYGLEPGVLRTAAR